MLKGMRVEILKQEYRLKKLKADRVEGLLESKDTTTDEIANADRTLEALMMYVIKTRTQDKEKEKKYIEIAKKHFQVWRDFLSGIPPRRYF